MSDFFRKKVVFEDVEISVRDGRTKEYGWVGIMELIRCVGEALIEASKEPKEKAKR